jgi:lipoprotein NlpD
MRASAAVGRAGQGGRMPVPAPAAGPAASAGRDADDDVNWLWPSQGPIVTGFEGTRSKGVAISGKEGDPVLAAADGRVVYAGSGLRGYGNLIIIKHNDTLLTAYAHNKALLVREDQMVRRGQKIAEMGSSDTDRVKLHFEVRRKGKPVDPVKVLPAR